MKLRDREKSSNLDDRRGLTGGKAVVGGGIIGIIIFHRYRLGIIV
jgi:predicted metalloprotease